jgi:hypothetical protein
MFERAVERLIGFGGLIEFIESQNQKNIASSTNTGDWEISIRIAMMSKDLKSPIMTVQSITAYQYLILWSWLSVGEAFLILRRENRR